MRELKFRAWVYDGNTDSYFMAHNVMVGGFSETVGQIWSEIYPNHWVNLIGDEPIMQYTGREDRNGKEIFENDLWKTGDSVFQVVFECCQWSLKHISGAIQYPAFYGRAQTGEIIGNIYEGTSAK
jgi:hypothetical protein